MIAYKLVKLRKNGTLGSLFIGASNVLPIGEWMYSEYIPTKGYSPRQGFHCTLKPEAPHLSKKGRVWVKVKLSDYTFFERPESQGGIWIIAHVMKILEVLPNV